MDIMDESDLLGREDKGELLKRDVTTTRADVDHFLRLPISIIHHILSFIPPEYVSVTSELSKTWNHYFSKFNSYSFFYHYHYYLIRRRHGAYLEDENMKQEFMNFVENKIENRILQGDMSADIHALSITIFFPGLGMLAHFVDGLVGSAIERNVSKLSVNVRNCADEWNLYCLPGTVLTARSLRSLHLCSCIIEENLDINLPNLQELSLTRVLVLGDLLQNLAIFCPFIESLKIFKCKDLRKIKMDADLPKLKFIRVVAGSKLLLFDLKAPNLCTFVCMIMSRSGRTNQTQMEIILDVSANLKEFKLCRTRITFASFQKILSANTGMEILEVDECISSGTLIMSNNSLKTLHIRNSPNLSIVDSCSTNLVSLSYVNPSMSFNAIKAPNLLKVHIELQFGSHNILWWSQLKDLLLMYFLEDLKLVVNFVTQENIVVHDKCNEVSFSSLSYLEELNPVVSISSLSYGDLMDYMFESCHPKTLSILSPRSKAFELLNENMCRPYTKKQAMEARLWRSEISGFEECPLAEESMCSASKEFLAAYSTVDYHPTTLLLKWNEDIYWNGRSNFFRV